MEKRVYQRRFDIDWLRTLAFMVLILYHVGMYYVADWGRHIKSKETFEFLQNIMLLTNPWRMSLLFFISAIALALVEQKYQRTSLLKLRSVRLLLPLLFGMFVIVVPQTYYEALDQSLIEPGFWAFWIEYINPNTNLLKEHHSPIGLLTWNHLWFLPYLWVYTVIVLVARRPLRELAQLLATKSFHPLVLTISVVALLAMVWLLLRADFPSTHALLDDWYNHGKYFLVFSTGYLFASQTNWWQFVIDKRLYFLVVGIVCYGLAIADRNGAFDALAEAYQTSLSLQLLYSGILSLNHWAWIFCVVGYAGAYLNRPSKLLNYSTKAILPWYLLHQTLIIVFAWWLRALDIAVSIEAVLLVMLTALGCGVGYELIRRNRLLRWLSGMKPVEKS